jgi:hypothetical protein
MAPQYGAFAHSGAAQSIWPTNKAEISAIEFTVSAPFEAFSQITKGHELSMVRRHDSTGSER